MKWVWEKEIMHYQWIYAEIRPWVIIPASCLWYSIHMGLGYYAPPLHTEFLSIKKKMNLTSKRNITIHFTNTKIKSNKLKESKNQSSNNTKVQK